MAAGDRECILVVDDDPKIRTLLRRCFEPEDYAVKEAANGREMMSVLESGRIDLITLDLGLPGEDGLTLARRVREISNVPIIMVTGKGDMIDRIVGLEVGADDYISKPFHVREVLARVRSVLRRARNDGGPASVREASVPDGGSFRFGPWEIDIAMRELRASDGSRVDLTTAEFGLLELLLRHPRQVLSRDRIMDLLKGRDWTPYDRAIDTLVARLRKKIEANPAQPGVIKTVRGVGYILTANVERIGTDASHPGKGR